MSPLVGPCPQRAQLCQWTAVAGGPPNLPESASHLSVLLEQAPAQFWRLGAARFPRLHGYSASFPIPQWIRWDFPEVHLSDAECRRALDPNADQGQSTCQFTLESGLQDSSHTITSVDMPHFGPTSLCFLGLDRAPLVGQSKRKIAKGKDLGDCSTEVPFPAAYACPAGGPLHLTVCVFVPLSCPTQPKLASSPHSALARLGCSTSRT